MGNEIKLHSFNTQRNATISRCEIPKEQVKNKLGHDIISVITAESEEEFKIESRKKSKQAL